jgi:hypothetical protein
MCVGNEREKMGKWFQEENDDVWEHDRDYIYVRGRDLRKEGTRRGRESATKIFEKGARRNVRWMEGKREIPPDRVCQWRSGKIKRAKGRWMNVEHSERDKDTDKQERRERIKESRYNREYERWQRKFRSTWGRECKRKKYDGEKETKEGEPVWNGCSEMRERERKERGELQNEGR